jgi:hypothetical protein
MIRRARTPSPCRSHHYVCGSIALWALAYPRHELLWMSPGATTV